MYARIEPSKTADKGGYLMMPLKKNVPYSKDGTWVPAVCPECGCGCWDRPLPEGFTEEMFSGKLCTMCAIKRICGMEGEKGAWIRVLQHGLYGGHEGIS